MCLETSFTHVWAVPGQFCCPTSSGLCTFISLASCELAPSRHATLGSLGISAARNFVHAKTGPCIFPPLAA